VEVLGSLWERTEQGRSALCLASLLQQPAACTGWLLLYKALGLWRCLGTHAQPNMKACPGPPGSSIALTCDSIGPLTHLASRCVLMSSVPALRTASACWSAGAPFARHPCLGLVCWCQHAGATTLLRLSSMNGPTRRWCMIC